MKIKELMKKNVITVTRNDDLETAIKLLEKHDIGMLVVKNNNNQIEGVITDRDILIRKVLKDKNLEGKINDAMTYTVISINEEEDIKEAINKLKNYQLRRLPVINNKNELSGIVTISDLSICKLTNKEMNSVYREIVMPNPQTEKPLKYLKTDDFPL